MSTLSREYEFSRVSSGAFGVDVGVRRRSRREVIKMTGLISLIVFALVITVVYGVHYSESDGPTFRYFQRVESANENDKYKKISNSTIWTYECRSEQCERRPADTNEIRVSLEQCNMLCSNPSLWPKPRSVYVSNKSVSSFLKNQIKLKINSPSSIKDDLKQAFRIFLNTIPDERKFRTQDEVDVADIFINLTVTKDDNKPKQDTDESYTLSVTKSNSNITVNISSTTYFGARHGLETLSQLIWLDSVSQKLLIYHDISIRDKPMFPHRGLMVDTARNFFPMKQLLKVVDGMAANKLNVFHLHLTDSVSFPIVLPNNPWLAKYGAYSPEKVYTPEEVKSLVEYARIRGIRVILEVDVPSHINEGWNYANKNDDKIVICGEEDVNGGHLNPDNPRSFKLLESIYSDLIQLGTDNETFHIGGDEVDLNCYGKTNAASHFSDPHEFWADLNHKIFKTVSNAFNNQPPKNIVIWSNDLTSNYMSYLKYTNNLVVQFWYGQLDPILRNGNKVIFSTVSNWYLDCGFGPWKSSNDVGNCDPYRHWKAFYTYRPWYEYHTYRQQVLGGEACLWSEQVGVDDLETRIWPRTAAMAERLWSDIPIFDSKDVFTRISTQRERLIQRGLKAEATWPEWCTQNPGKC
ncbi:probable beta-hexosaminidase fdl isoform X2 [Diabrotica virgifera virgifera]|uniref:Beta-hexosaminidase n=1 Tax=Diabrotica virgifera virgifera TaxID=50390 RepID=A0ABM5ICF4_DIAVI|nr:probable beta-hexosaminidase fdl isoform X2 [Diabrotica virgifera virgifera]